MDILTVKPGFESSAILECTKTGFIDCMCDSNGIIIGKKNCADSVKGLCFSSWYVDSCQSFSVGTGRNGVQCVADWFCEAIRSSKITESWNAVWLRSSENGFLPDISSINRVLELLKKRISRVVKLADTAYPPANVVLEGLFVVEKNKSELYISRNAVFFGPRRMKDDSAAPSRSYLKIEEAFSVMGYQPRAGERVVDLGAAPGGWSYAAAKRGALVSAIDNGPMKNGAADNSNIEHIRADAFKWQPQHPVEWLFCDMVEEPSRVIALVKQWIGHKLCSNAVVNLKCGRTEPYDILKLVKSPDGISSMVKECICSHLYHDRDEFTVMLRV
ncbi:MAG TPA: SAM-dependent methyltransferase [Chitinispirillaceae bacterium]|nr:SAM-dependent methyltransferase [Chitinispirillaceae bacterium]